MKQIFLNALSHVTTLVRRFGLWFRCFCGHFGSFAPTSELKLRRRRLSVPVTRQGQRHAGYSPHKQAIVGGAPVQPGVAVNARAVTRTDTASTRVFVSGVMESAKSVIAE